LLDEDAAAKALKMQKKMELKQIMDKDAANKKQFADRTTQNQYRKGGDFGEENVLSYCYI
jgi:hypothetical protein